MHYTAIVKLGDEDKIYHLEARNYYYAKRQMLQTLATESGLPIRPVDVARIEGIMTIRVDDKDDGRIKWSINRPGVRIDDRVGPRFNEEEEKALKSILKKLYSKEEVT